MIATDLGQTNMTLTFLGTGTSGGVPSIGCTCEVCQSTDPHDKRLRCVAMLETEHTRLLIDCGPDARQQLLGVPFRAIDGVILTHIHYDHVAGIDDLRPFCAINYPEKQSIPIYANQATADALRVTMPYCFGEHLYPGVPLLDLKTIEPHVPFKVGDFDIIPFIVYHHDLPIFAYRIGPLVYITDMKSIDDAEIPYAEDAELLVVNALRWHKPHHSHQTVEEAVDFARRVRARRTLLIHGNHQVGLHEQTNALLPPDIQLAYDGMQIQL